ncbi:uncharacterized protein VNE69_03127 [Vairimorpha necatrix]|uniref:Uncharacterized protein n=1 Tax=Vairimorpha necatrix TaxID=6039 RepID=A0AAX4JAL9_9MICR
MGFSIKYKIITPCLTYVSPPRHIITINTKRVISKKYLHTKNILKEKFKLLVPHLIIWKYNPAYKKHELEPIKYKKSMNCYITTKKEIVHKKHEILKYCTQYHNNIYINDYFYYRKIQENIPVNIKIYKKKNIKTSKKNVNFINKYKKPEKYSLLALNFLTSTSQEKDKKFCIFNFRNVKGNEELYLYLKKTCELIEVEEENNMVLVYDNKKVYYQGEINISEEYEYIQVELFDE